MMRATLEEILMRTTGTRIAILAVAVVAAVLADPSIASAQRRGGTVYYQVTYEDGDVADLSKIPSTDRNIRRVVRILRLNRGDRGLRSLSTEETTFVSSGGRTYRDELTWNGKAWVLHEQVRQAQPTTTKATSSGDPNTADAAKTLKTLLAEQRALAAKRVKTYAQRLAKQTAARKAAEKALAEAKDENAQAVARGKVKSAKALETQLETLLALSRQTLKTLEDDDTKFGKPTGKVVTADKVPPLKKDGGGGVAEPISETHVMPHRVQVWRAPLTRTLKKNDGPTTYRVSMAHPEAGALGEFYYVAYADTDGDGQPDKLIARSPLARATEAGDWTSWSFASNQERIYVGNALPRARGSMYAERFEKQSQWVGMGDRPWVSDTFGAAPAARGWPFLSNLRIEVQVPWD